MFDQFTTNALTGTHDAAINAAEQAAQTILQTASEATHTICFKTPCEGYFQAGAGWVCHKCQQQEVKK